jgi:hypothetical protein
MTFSNINVSTPNSGLGDKLRDAFVKVNENFSSIGEIVTPDYISATLSNYATLDYVDNELTDVDTELLSIINRLNISEGNIVDIEAEINSLTLLVNGKASLTQLNNSISNINDTISTLQTLVDKNIDEAPIDGFAYVRLDGSWIKLNDLLYSQTILKN